MSDRVHQVVAGDAEAAGCDLFDGAAPARVVEPVDVLAALARIRPAAEVVHRDRHGLVGLGRDGAVTHCAGVEPGDDRFDGLDFFEGDRRPQPCLQLEQATQRAALAGQPVDLLGVLLEDVVATGAGRMLEQEDDFGCEQVKFALAPERVLSADVEPAVHPFGRILRVGTAMSLLDLLGEHVESDSAELARRAREVLVDHVAVQTDRLESLCGGVGRDGGDAHLAHHLHHALAERLEVVAHGGGRLDAGELTLADQVLDRLERQIRVDRGGAESDQHRDVVHFAGVAAFDDQCNGGAFLGAHQMVVHRGDREQRRDRCAGVVGIPIGDDKCASAFGDRLAGPDAEVLDGVGQALAAALDVVQRAQHGGPQPGMFTVVVDVDDLVQLVVVEHRPRQLDLAARRRRRLQQVLFGSHDARHRGDDRFADRVKRRVGHLGEQFDEVVVEQPCPLRQHRGRGVGAHRAERFGPGCRHGRQQNSQIFLGVAERDLPAHDGFVVGLGAIRSGSVIRSSSPACSHSP